MYFHLHKLEFDSFKICIVPKLYVGVTMGGITIEQPPALQSYCQAIEDSLTSQVKGQACETKSNF